MNGDGEVHSNDAFLTLSIAAGAIGPTDYQIRTADMDDDGRIRSIDAMLILRRAAGLATPGMDNTVGN